MLKIGNKNVILTAYSNINEKNVEGYQVSIKSDDPYDMTISRWKIDEELYKANIIQCRKDYAEFENIANALQDEMISQSD